MMENNGTPLRELKRRNYDRHSQRFGFAKLLLFIFRLSIGKQLTELVDKFVQKYLVKCHPHASTRRFNTSIRKKAE